jgi:hypothetical protein
MSLENTLSLKPLSDGSTHLLGGLDTVTVPHDLQAF